MTKTIGIALLGLGNVGGGVIKLLEENAAAIEARLGARIVVRAIAVRDPDKAKRVVTANKALLAEHGGEVFAAAEAAGVDVYYEAAVCGGVPIIRVLREGLASDRVESLIGIVNGTSNYILTTMTETRRPFG